MQAMSTENAPNPDTGLVRLSVAANRLGLSERIARKALASKQIPIDTLVIGQTLHVRAADLNAFLTRPFQPARPTNPNPDLFK